MPPMMLSAISVLVAISVAVGLLVGLALGRRFPAVSTPAPTLMTTTGKHAAPDRKRVVLDTPSGARRVTQVDDLFSLVQASPGATTPIPRLTRSTSNHSTQPIPRLSRPYVAKMPA